MGGHIRDNAVDQLQYRNRKDNFTTTKVNTKKVNITLRSKPAPFLLEMFSTYIYFAHDYEKYQPVIIRTVSRKTITVEIKHQRATSTYTVIRTYLGKNLVLGEGSAHKWDRTTCLMKQALSNFLILSRITLLFP
jgi:hypothetical protein